ncbi:MAG: hypothetical protein IKZ34_03730 [Alphaproteobacteria bacterium]|nr:hypothetical protein [Alphaproteobacteria bacterium]
MSIPIETINEFHLKRTQAHIDCLNYHAALLGYHFPEHDNDKNSGPMMIAYSYTNYARYHPEYNIPETYIEFCRTMRAEHHATQAHHLEHYADVSEISNLTLIEMVCDWFSASFEQRYITHEDPNDYTVQEFFDTLLRNNPEYKWSNEQIELICSTIDFLEMYANHDEIMKIYTPLLSM